MSNEVEENLTLFFRRFLDTPEEMDAHLGFRATQSFSRFEKDTVPMVERVHCPIPVAG
jgi:hypothetical protein